jgi:hypothetical protein
LVPEDGMLFEVRDWLNGIYMVRYVSKEEGQELRSHGGPWVAKLEQGFQRTFDTFGIRIPIDEQIAYSYYYGGRELLQDPPLHLGGFLEASHRVYIIPFGMQTRVWHEKEFNFDQVYALVTDVPKKKGFAGLLEGICAPCSVAEVEAFIQDELFRCKGLVKEEREDDYFNAVITRIFGDDTKFFTDWQWQELFKYFQKLWEKAAKSYNYFKDQVTGKARSSVITILEAYYGWFRTLSTMEVMPQEIPMQMMTSLSQAHSTLVDYLWLVDNSDEEEQHDIRSLTEILPAVNTSLESLKQYVLDHITAGRKQTGNSKLRLVRPSDLEEAPPAEPKHIFVLRISLKGITPQIWRSVQVPGSFTLGDLHYVIQDAMGWDDAHLHQFEINAVRYGPKGELDFSNFDMEDEDDYTLDDLGLVEKQRFFYTYDFEDDWIHQILVSKILPSEGFSQEDQQYPRCLKGKRACPPEDCGGINGYEEILEALAGPKKKKSRELLEWVGDFDPEYFDVDQVNTRLQSDDDEDEASNEDE